MKRWIWKVRMEMIVNHNIGNLKKKLFISKHRFLSFSYSDDDEDITSEEDADVRLTGT
jgi:hypothetical protein